MNKGVFPGLGRRSDIPKDLTGATEDYLLGMGETAIINFSNVYTIPLHIDCSEGIYEVFLYVDRAQTPGGRDIVIQPNNQNYTDAFNRADMQITHAHSDTGAHTPEGYHYPIDAFWHWFGSTGIADFKISTYLQAKTMLFRCSSYSGTDFVVGVSSSIWENTTTPWTSLGTLSFNNNGACSGKIVIKRII